MVLYARYYMSPADPVPRFFAFLLAFMGAMLGRGALGQPDPAGLLLGADQPLLVPADRLLAPHAGRARDGARMALTVTAAGGLCLLAGVLLLGHIVGSYDLDARAGRRRPDPRAPALPAGARA